jgi:hypothetical protein
LRIADCGFCDYRFWDLRFGKLRILDRRLRRINHQSAIEIDNPQSRSTIRNLNRQSAI